MPGPAVPPASESSWFVDRKVSNLGGRRAPRAGFRRYAGGLSRLAAGVGTHTINRSTERRMAQQIIARAPGKPDVYAYDVETDANEVNQSLHDIIAQYKMKIMAPQRTS
jgi:hypothetical protein